MAKRSFLVNGVVNRSGFFTAVGCVVALLVGCKAAVTLTGNVKAEPSTVQMCDTVTFTPELKLGNLKPNQIKYVYDFGDGSPKVETTDTSTTHIYIRPAQFSVQVRIFLDTSPQPSLEIPVTINVRSGLECTYIVRLKGQPASSKLVAQQANALAIQFGGDLLYTYESVFPGLAARFTSQEAEKVAKHSDVAQFELSRKVVMLETQSNVPSWGLDRIDQPTRSLNGTYKYPDTGAGVNVYVVDSGIRATHQEFENRVRPGYSVIPGKNATEDCNGHGTHVAGIIGGKTFGVAKGVSLYPVRVFDCGDNTSVAAIIAGIEWVTKIHPLGQSAVLNLSAGIADVLDSTPAESYLLSSALKAVADRGVVVVTATGNNSGNGCLYSPANLGIHDYVINVGATTSQDTIWNVSNYGPCIDLFAPGEDIGSAGKDSDQDEEIKSGTSMAAPHVSGVAALYLATHPTATAKQVQDALLQGALNRVLSGIPVTIPTPNRLLNTAFLGESQVRVSVEPSNPTLFPGQDQVFTATVVGSSNTNVNWKFEEGGVVGNERQFSYTAQANPGIVKLTAISVADPSKRATTTITIQPIPTNISGVSIDPSASTIFSGETVGLTATVSGTGNFNKAVFWRIKPNEGSLSSDVSNSTVYTAPPVAQESTFFVEAVSVGNPAKTAQASITVKPTGVTISIDPTSASLDVNQSQEFTATVRNTSNTRVTWSSSGGELIVKPNAATFSASTPGIYVVTARSLADTSKVANAAVSVAAPDVTIDIEPKTANMAIGQTQKFTATVKNATNTNVSWTASGGTLSLEGNSADFSSSEAGTYTLTVKSSQDTSKTASANISVTVDNSPPTITLSGQTNIVTSSGPFLLMASAADNVGVAKVEFYEGTAKFAEDANAGDGFKQTLNLTSSDNGYKTYRAKAYDFSGNNVVSNPVGVTVNIPPPAKGLDSTFGVGGNLTTDFASKSDGAQALVIQGDGKIVAGGYTHDGFFDNFALTRYNTNGSLDTSFGSGGKVTTGFDPLSSRIQSLAIQSDGKIVAGGYTSDGSNEAFALVRYNTDGSLDTGFDTDGKVLIDLTSGKDRLQSLAIQSDGKLVVGGYANNTAFAVARLNLDGLLDSGFGVNGKVITEVGSSSHGYSIGVQSDGKIVLAGGSHTTRWQFALVRYNSDGSLDSAFGVDGKVLTSVGASTDQATAMVVQSDNKIVVLGYSINVINWDFAVVRYKADGSLDTAFDNDGKITIDLGAELEQANSIAVQNDGKIVVGGFTQVGGPVGSRSAFALARLNHEGSLDTSFDDDGKVTNVFNEVGGTARALAIQSDGKIVQAGNSDVSSNNQDFALARYNP